MFLWGFLFFFGLLNGGGFLWVFCGFLGGMWGVFVGFWKVDEIGVGIKLLNPVHLYITYW